jgi:hypothetical protein
MSVASIVWAPLLPLEVLLALACLSAVTLATALFRRPYGHPPAGFLWRGAGVLALLAALGNPSVIIEDREALDDVVVIVSDGTASQNIGERRARADAALGELTEALAARDDIETHVVRVGPGDSGPAAARTPADGTRLFGALQRALGEIPRQRLAGVLFLTDGQVHDAPDDPASLELGAPLHTLLTGDRDEGDRRLTIVQSPGYGIVGQSIGMTIRIDEPEAVRARQAQLTIRRDGQGDGETILVPVGVDHTIDLDIDRGGPGVFELSVAAGARELTLDNNRGVVVVNGVRDRLRVLLVSGEPHPGERTWRNLLKADPSVDLVHFTILRPPEKQDGTPVRELSLIAFPIRELFEIKLDEFDLIIFDRYQRRGVLPSLYLGNIARYVEEGGALLEAGGPGFASINSLYRTPLSTVLPSAPTGEVIAEPFRASITTTGHRHPVTSLLPGGNRPSAGRESRAGWGRWFRQVEATTNGGEVLLSGTGEHPLLVLDRVGEGRVAQLMSDHIWLWARNYEGGGPHAELLRRLAHWLMKEPELEEDMLSGEVHGSELQVVRRSLEPDDAPVTVTFPSGRIEQVVLDDLGSGRAVGRLEVDEAGLYRLADGNRTAIAAVGALNPLEFSDVVTTGAILEPVAAATGGGMFWLADSGLPALRRVEPGRDMAGSAGSGSQWIGLQENGQYDVRGVTELPLLPGLVLLLLALATLLFAWHREGR